MDVFYGFTYGTAGWLVLQALPLLISPTVMVTMLSPDVRQPTPLEQYFSRSLGIALITIAVLNILLTGSIPLTSSLADAVGEGATTEANERKAPYALPTLTITTTYHSVIAFFCYTRYNTTGSMAFAIGSIGHASLAAVGLWCFLFATSSGRITRETLVDKRMSGWPLKNSEADKKRSPKSR